MGSLTLRPGNSLTVPKTALSVSFTRFVSSTDVTQATGLLTLAPVGLTPTEHASLRWTHSLRKLYREGCVPYLPPDKRTVRIKGSLG